MSAWQHVPGVVVPCSVVFARCGAASASPAHGGPVNLPRPIDADITTGYVDTLTRHCGHSFHFGVASHLVLIGDSDWFQGVLPNTIVSLLTKFILTARETSSSAAMVTSGGGGVQLSGIPSGSVGIAAGSFDVSGGGSGKAGFDGNTLRLDIRFDDPIEMCHRACGVLQAAASQSGKRIAWIRATVPDYMGCEISSTFFIPPPLEIMSWEVHHYLRQVDNDLLLSRNALTMFVWHTSSSVVNMSQLPSSGEAFVTMAKQKERLCAAIPNTPAAKYLLEGVDGHHSQGGREGSPQRGPGSEDILAMESELASLRAACLQLGQRNQQLEHDMSQLKAVASQQQQMHQALLAGAASIAHATPGGGGGGARGALLLPPMIARDNGKQMVAVGGRATSPPPGDNVMPLQQQQDRSGWGHFMQQLSELEELLAAIQSSVLSVQPNDVLKGCLLWRQKEAGTLHLCLQTILTEVGRDLPPSLSAATSLGHVTVGVSTGADPLTDLYRQRLQDTERELVRLAEFDVDGLTSQFYTDELQRMEAEATAWMTKYHAVATSLRGEQQNTTAAAGVSRSTK
jgi:hypothetical protein